MYIMRLDWDKKIRQICEINGIDVEMYQHDDVVKDCVAQKLGFSSFDVFQALPEPSAIIDGRGDDMLDEHQSWQLSIGMDCIELIGHHWILHGDYCELHRRTENLIKYIEQQFTEEYAVVIWRDIQEKLITLPEFNIEEIPSYERARERYAKYFE